jgi:hypothetical protein
MGARIAVRRPDWLTPIDHLRRRPAADGSSMIFENGVLILRARSTPDIMKGNTISPPSASTVAIPDTISGQDGRLPVPV